MMVDACVGSACEVREGQPGELGDGIVGGGLSRSDSFDQRPKFVFIHRPIVAKIPKISSVGTILW